MPEKQGRVEREEIGTNGSPDPLRIRRGEARPAEPCRPVRPYRATNGEHRCYRLLDSDGVGAPRRGAHPGRPEGMTRNQKRP